MKTRKKHKAYLPLYMMMVPGLLYLIVNNYLPMFGIVAAFKEMNITTGFLGGDWIGFKNFEYLFKTKDAYVITRNTILYNLSFIVIVNICAIFVAILLNEIRHNFLKRLYQSVILLPYLLSMVIVGYIVYAFLGESNGFMNNYVLPFFNMEEISWYMKKNVWPFIIPTVHLWKSIGFSCVIYLASIVSIDTSYYEAAKLDGASKLKQFTRITFPLLKPTIILLVILSLGQIFRSDFGLFYQVPMNSGAIYETTNVIDTYVFRGLMQLGDLGMSTAAGLYQSVVGLILILLSNYIIGKISSENKLF